MGPMSMGGWTDRESDGIAPPPRRRGGAGGVLPLLVVTVAVTGGLLWLREAASEQLDQVAEIISVAGGRPPLPADAGLSRLVAPPQAPGGADGYSLLLTNDRGVAAYDPCRPLHLVVGMKGTKVVEDFLRPLLPLAASLWAVAEPGQHLATPVERIIAASGGMARPGPTVAAALAAMPRAGAPARVLVCGSLYLAGEVLKLDAP